MIKEAGVSVGDGLVRGVIAVYLPIAKKNSQGLHWTRESISLRDRKKGERFQPLPILLTWLTVHFADGVSVVSVVVFFSVFPFMMAFLMLAAVNTPSFSV